jgi:4-amino-4-deoxy-L-arabinose transferase-like glycosyltransferase
VRHLPLIYVLAVFYLTLFYQLGNLAFIGADEPRYARIAEEMNLRGNYITPTLEDRPWLEKPPLLFWAEAGSFRVFGVSEWSARLPVALLAGLGAGMTAWLALHLGGPRAGFLAFLIVLTSGMYFVYGRAGSTDMPLVATLTAALVLAFLGSIDRRVWLVALAGAALGLAVLAKGPVALILFGGILFFYCLVRQSYPWSWTQTVAGSAAFLLVGVPWYWLVWLENGPDFVLTFWLNHNLARFLTPIHHHSQPFWYFLPVVLLGAFPWSIFLISSAARLIRTRTRVLRDSPGEVFLWLWFLIPFLFFSAGDSKLAGYILPVMPAVAILVALEWERVLSLDLLAYRWFKTLFLAMIGLAVPVLVALVFGFYSIYGSLATGAALAFPLATGLGVSLYYFRTGRFLPAFTAVVTGLTLFAAFAFWLAAPVFDKYHSARDVSYAALPLLAQDRPLILYRYFHHSALYYTGYRSTREAIVDRESLRSYFAAHPQEQYLILTQRSGWEDLREGFGARLVSQKGNLYLVQLENHGRPAARAFPRLPGFG